MPLCIVFLCDPMNFAPLGFDADIINSFADLSIVKKND